MNDNLIMQESELSVPSRQGTLKEESSDESTIISSQTSTLTRNINPDAMNQVSTQILLLKYNIIFLLINFRRYCNLDFLKAFDYS